MCHTWKIRGKCSPPVITAKFALQTDCFLFPLTRLLRDIHITQDIVLLASFHNSHFHLALRRFHNQHADHRKSNTCHTLGSRRVAQLMVSF